MRTTRAIPQSRAPGAVRAARVIRHGGQRAGEHVHDDRVVPPADHHEIGQTAGRRHVGLVHGADGVEKLGEDAVDIPTALVDVPMDAAGQANVVGGIHEDLDVHQVEEARMGEHQDPLDDDDGPRCEILAARQA